MSSISQALGTTIAILRERWRALIGFTLLFRIIESVFCAPLVALAGKWLLGRTVLDSTALISFLLSARGVLALVLGATTVLTIRLVEHAGLSAIFFGALEKQAVSGREALRLIWERLFDLVLVAARFVVIALLVALPLLAVAGGIAARLLSQHDVNYYLKLKPPEFLTAAAVIGVLVVLTAVVIVLLVVRWRWVVQAVLFEQKRITEAFVRSAKLTDGIRWRMTAALAVVSLFALLLGGLASLFGTLVTSAVLSVIGEGVASLAVAFGALLLLRTVITAICTFFGACVDAGVFTGLYRGQIKLAGGQPSLSQVGGTGEFPRWVPIGLVAGLTLFAGLGAWLAVEAMAREQIVTIHAHRGVAEDVPENTLGALRAAIAAKADYLETDVQLSKDGVLVIAHDSDFSRLGGVAKKVWELTYEEIRAIPLRVSGKASGEITPTLDVLLAEAKGKIKVNLELKYYGDHQPGLARKVIEAVRAQGMLDQVVIQCLEYAPLLEVRKLAPGVPLGYLLSFNAREPAQLKVDFLSVEQNRIDRRFVTKAHQRGQQVYAWTVNKAKDMHQLIDLGIDGLITDQSDLARQTVIEHLNRSSAERSTRQIRAWLAN